MEGDGRAEHFGAKHFGAEPLPGAVVEQHLRCHRPNCHCRHGELHGPYYYRVWREGRRVHKQYVRPEDLAAVRAACDAHRQLKGLLKEIRRRREALARVLRQEQRRAERLLGVKRRRRRPG